MHLITPITDVLCVHVASFVFFAKPNYTIRAELLKLTIQNFTLTHLIQELHYFALVTFPQEIVLHRVAKKNLIRGQGLAVGGVSKFKVDVIFQFFTNSTLHWK